jgi:hypothetical protein
MYQDEYRWRREHGRQIWLTILQYIFWVAMVGCMIALIWNPIHWIQIVATAALLLFAGGVCKSGRS